MRRWSLALAAAVVAAAPARASLSAASAASSGGGWQAAAFSAARPLAGGPMPPALARVVEALDLSRPDHPKNQVILAPLAASLATARPGAAWNEAAFAGLADERRAQVLSAAAAEAADLATHRAMAILSDFRAGRIRGPRLRRTHDDAEALWLGARLYMEPGLWRNLGEALPVLKTYADRYQADRRRRLETQVEETAAEWEERPDEGAAPVKDGESVRWDDPSGYDGFLAHGDGKYSGYDMMKDRQEEHKRRNPNQERGLKPSSDMSYYGRDSLPPADPDPRAQEDWRLQRAFLSDRDPEAAANASYPLSGVDAWYGEKIEAGAKNGHQDPYHFWLWTDLAWDMLDQKLRYDVLPLLRKAGRLGPWGRALLPALRRQVQEFAERLDRLQRTYDIPGAGGVRGAEGGRRGIFKGRLELLNLIDRAEDRLKRKEEKSMGKAARLSAAVVRRAEDMPLKEIGALARHFARRIEAAKRDGDPAHPREVVDQLRAGAPGTLSLGELRDLWRRALAMRANAPAAMRRSRWAMLSAVLFFVPVIGYVIFSWLRLRSARRAMDALGHLVSAHGSSPP